MIILEVLVPTFLVLALGVVSVLAKVFKPEDSYVLSKYNYYFGFPALIFHSLYQLQLGEIGDWRFLATNLLGLTMTTALLLLAAWLFKLPRKFTGMLVFAGVFGNVAYMGIPISELLFGNAGVGLASVVVGLVVVFALSIGMFFLELFTTHDPSLHGVLRNLSRDPIVVAIVLGVLGSWIQLSLPIALNNFLVIVARSAGPLALFAIGMFLVREWTALGQPKVWALTGANILLLPLVTYGAGWLVGLSGLALQISVLQAAMPLAATIFIVAQKRHIAEELVSGATILSTLLSILTIGGLMLLFGRGLVPGL